MADKSTRWAFTAFENEWPLFQTMPDVVAEWEWQPEVCPDTQRKHYQGYIRTKRQVRFAQLRAVLPRVHLEVAKNWEALIQYCRKDKTKAGASTHQVNGSRAMTMADALTRIAAHATCLYWSSNFEDRLISEYWSAVKEILSIDPNAVGLFTQPQYLRAWQHTYSVWCERAEELVSHAIDSPETDRQTDTECMLDVVVKRQPKKISRQNINAPSPSQGHAESEACDGE